MSQIVTIEGLENVRISEPIECDCEILNHENPKCEKTDWTWLDIQDNISNCKRCSAHLDRPSMPLLPEGNHESRFVFVLRNPLSIDTPLSGYMRSDSNYGQVFQLYLKALGIQRAEAYVTGTIFCPIPDSRFPMSEERSICQCFKEIEFGFLRNVRIIFLMGEDAIKQFVDERLSIRSDWSNLFYCSTTPKTYLVPILHVGFYLNNENEQMGILKHLTILRHRFVDPIRKGLL